MGSGPASMPNSTARAEYVAPGMRNQDSITQINDRDREHMRAFPSHIKVDVVEKIMTRRPSEIAVYHGNNDYEKAMMNIHREGYGLIDIQRHETAFTSVWYRKNRTLIGKSTEVTMLMWEEGENGGTTTMKCWKN